ncbi:MAG TPA: hypothetical protein VJX67_20595 [Blastocatellia bacterium]|nr:hypothetical protein [Blastocatellia bacterium]
MANTKVRTYSATDRDVAMLDAIARYHGLNKSATITSLLRKEFWRIFPAGTDRIKPDQGAQVKERVSSEGKG